MQSTAPKFDIGEITPKGKIVGREHGLRRNPFVKKLIVNDWIYYVQPEKGPYEEITEKELLSSLKS